MEVIKFLTLWLKDIVLVFVFISIVEMIIPSGNMKKYINMIIGFLIIIVIINPFVKLFYKDYSFNKDLYKNHLEGINILYEGDEELIKTQEKQIRSFYMEKVERELGDLIIDSTNYTIEKINTTIDEGDRDFGKLLTIEVFLMEKGESAKEKDNTIMVSKIENVSITQAKESDVQYREIIDSKIKKTISEHYNLPEENIKIFLNNKGEGELGG